MMLEEIIISTFILSIVSYINTYVSRETRKKYIQKNPQVKFKTNLIPREILDNVKNVNIPNINYDDYDSKIKDFALLLNTIEPEENLKLFKRNINSLKIKDNKLLLMFNINAMYNSKSNKITIAKNSAIEHELFHMASSYYSNDNVEASGFHYKDLNKNEEIGVGINEGYTQMLTKKYFNCNDQNVYEKEVKYVNYLINLIGRDKMDNLYFNANLGGLVEELSNYSTEFEVFKFIRALDDIENRNNINIANKFLIECDLNKNLIEGNTRVMSYIKTMENANDLPNADNKNFISKFNDIFTETYKNFESKQNNLKK